MNELFIKIHNLKNELDNLKIIKNLNYYNNLIINNEILKTKIDKYYKDNSKDLLFEIYNYEEIKKYKECETEINLLIMMINSKLKKITNSGDIYESN